MAYSFEPALPALAALAQRGVRLVLASSKTRVEMEWLARSLGARSPLIVENGGAILLPSDDGAYDAMPRGVPRSALVRALREIAEECGVALSGFSSFTPNALRQLTGLDRDAARRALAREFDEPFLLEDAAAAAAVTAAAARRGLAVTRGGRFLHLTGTTDKGEALRELVTILSRDGGPFCTVGLGDAGNDLSLLRSVDRPIVVPRRDGDVDPQLASALPRAERAPAPGPGGWNAAVLTVLAGGRLPRVAGEGSG